MRLEPERVRRTSEALLERVHERFPDRGITRLAQDLVEQAVEAEQHAPQLGEPIRPVRMLIWALGLLLVGLVFATLYSVHMPDQLPELLDLVEFVEATVNNLVFIGLAVVFLLGFEARIKRRRVLAVIHRLRSLAHIIDMHQLTKDPHRITASHESTASSPTPGLNAFELRRYLDYCGEMLSLCGKIAALYAQHFDDEVVLGAVNEVEILTTGLTRKVWQKIDLVEKLSPTTIAPYANEAAASSRP